MQRRIVVSTLVLALVLALGASAAPIQKPVDEVVAGTNPPVGSAWWQPAMDWLRTWLGAAQAPAPTELSLEESGDSPPSSATQSTTLDPDQPPTEAGPKTDPTG